MPTCVLRMPIIETSWPCAFCCPIVCPLLLIFCDVVDASPCTVVAIELSDCNAVLAAPMMVLTLVMVSPNAEMFESCARAATAKPSLAHVV